MQQQRCVTYLIPAISAAAVAVVVARLRTLERSRWRSDMCWNVARVAFVDSVDVRGARSLGHGSKSTA
jgi:hypothetical protein